MGIRAQWSPWKFVVQLLLSLRSSWRYSKEKAEMSEELAGVPPRNTTESLHGKTARGHLKKTVAIPKIGVIFLALPWSRDYGNMH
jgi:hypothetical protein